MKTRCKPGELTVVVSGVRRYLGRVARVVRLVPVPGFSGDPHWDTDPQFLDYDGLIVAFADDTLQPIRPGDISDKEVADLYKAPPVPTEHKETV